MISILVLFTIGFIRFEKVPCLKKNTPYKMHDDSVEKKHDIVKLDVLPKERCVTISEKETKMDICTNENTYPIDISLHNVSIRVDNNADPMLLAQLIHLMQGVSC